MSAVIFFFGTGLAFYVGVALLCFAVLAHALQSRGWVNRVAVMVTLVGAGLVLLSATPLPFWLYGIGFSAVLIWLIGESVPRCSRARPWLRGIVLLIWCAAIGVELPYLFPPHLTALGNPRLVIVGDSVAAGMGGKRDDTWPTLLAREWKLQVLDLSQPGATARSAGKILERQSTNDNDLVLVEIGGNDVLGRTTAADFATHLDALLAQVSGENRVIVMFELPVPPLGNAFARAQRQLAAKYGALLIPKWMFIAVITGANATLDSIHLTPDGHRAMAETVWETIGPAYR